MIDEHGRVLGVAMRRALLHNALDLDLRIGELIVGPPIVVFETNSLRDVANLMAVEKIGRFPVVSQSGSPALVGIISRSDVFAAHRRQHGDDQLVPAESFSAAEGLRVR
jgi:CBS domain-containing protein